MIFFRRYGLYAAWLLSCIAFITSLYFSDIRHHEPCHLCWYQRICIFPMIVILGVASYRGFLGIGLYVLPQIVAGFFFAIYQVGIQEIPGWNPIDMCGAGPSCSERMDIGLGFITIPMLSAVAFLMIITLLVGTLIANRKATMVVQTE